MSPQGVIIGYVFISELSDYMPYLGPIIIFTLDSILLFKKNNNDNKKNNNKERNATFQVLVVVDARDLRVSQFCLPPMKNENYLLIQVLLLVL